MSDVTTELAMEASDKAMEIARLKAENDRLRESVRRLMTQRDERLARAEADNAKLRELLQDMNKWLWNGADCAECPFTAECDLNAAFESDLHAHVCIGWSKIHDRMRELEVDACPNCGAKVVEPTTNDVDVEVEQ